jgi:hypothetical protein
MVVSVGTRKAPVNGSRRAPSAARTGWGASAAHSAIAAKRPRPGQHRGGGKPEDGDQRVATPGAAPGVGDGGEVGEQVRGFGFLERIGNAEPTQPQRDGG